MLPSSPSSSLVTSFVLGAATVVSVLWLSGTLQRDGEGQHKTRNPQRIESLNMPTSSYAKSPSAARDGRNGTTDTETPMMDTPDLDNRMLRKAEAVVQWRTTRLLLVIERCVNDHNYSAILRTAEALGIQNVWMIDPPIDEGGELVDVEDEEGPANPEEIRARQGTNNVASPEEIRARQLHHLFARKAVEWLTVRDFSTTEDCVAELRKQGYALWVTDLSQEAVSLPMPSSSSDIKVPPKVALVMGTEAVGCSQYMLDVADLRVYLPLRGFADSLNLSVATALIIHHLFVMDPTLIGAISEEEKLELRKLWFTKLCQQRLLTPSQKRTRRKLLTLIKQCQTLHEQDQSKGGIPLQPKQREKLNNWEKYKEKLKQLDALIDPSAVQIALQEWIDNPPEPLGDMRRADSHRVTFVGKGTKKLHEDHWKDMVAVSNNPTPGVTAAVFRAKVNSVKGS